MQGQDSTRTGSAVGVNDLMAAWLASGGAIEALGDMDTRAARSRREVSPDHRLQASQPTRYSCAEDGLQASQPTRIYCGDDGLQAGGFSRSPALCMDDGL